MATDNKNILDLENREVGEEIQSDTRDLNNQNVPPPKAPPPTITRPMESVSQPIFSRDERVALTLLPLASALLQGKAPGGQSLLSSTLATAGQGLAGSGNVALRIKELEGQRRRETGTGLKSVKLQPTAGPVEIKGKVYTPEMNRQFTLDEATRLMYPPDTFTDVTTDRKGTIKTEKFGLFYVENEEEAKKLYPNNPRIQKIIVDPEKVGQPVIQNNKELAANVVFKDGVQVRETLDTVSIQPVGTTTDPLGQPTFQKDRASAEKYLETFGIKKGIKGYEAVINKIINPAKAGKPVFESGVGLVLSARRPDRAGSEIGFIGLAPEKDLKDIRFIGTLDEIKKLNKDSTALISQINSMSPRIGKVLNSLLSGVKTGVVEEFLLPFRAFAIGTLGATPKELENLSAQELIQKSAFALAPAMREKGSGSTSDMEFKAYMKAAVSLSNTPKANYISLYMLQKIKENANMLLALRKDLLYDGKTATEIENAVDEADPGIFKTYEGLTSNQEEENAWVATLKRGDVVYNRDINAEPIFRNGDMDLGEYIVYDGQGGEVFD
jgi:hypothetical protein|tara:strand:- start:9582 stop:11243 length:1662 start_codon:yes stop_codon:yes gene_type:complete